MSDKNQKTGENPKGKTPIGDMAKAGFGIAVDAVKTAAVWVLAGFMTKSVRNLIDKTASPSTGAGRQSTPISPKPEPLKPVEYVKGEWPKT